MAAPYLTKSQGAAPFGRKILQFLKQNDLLFFCIHSVTVACEWTHLQLRYRQPPIITLLPN